ncbi:MAG: M23 family metallopeptidase [Elusimicrobiota bacterium]|nr:M23 family metallopeptidase [Elusimicrobiota bacterium]
MGTVENQFCAELISDNGRYLLKSEAHKDIILIPETPGAILSSGKYSVTLEHQNLKTSTLQVTATIHGDSIKLLSKTPVDILLVQQNCLGETPMSNAWNSPFSGNNDSNAKAFLRRIVGKFADFRTGGGDDGHRHAGIDLRGGFGKEVYPINDGRVLAASFKDLSGGVVIEHLLPDGSRLYSKYVHIQDISVKAGEQVTPHTRLGRLFDKASFKKSRYTHNHLHLEIRKDYEDKGTDSSYRETRKDLERHCLDPEKFLGALLTKKLAHTEQGPGVSN